MHEKRDKKLLNWILNCLAVQSSRIRTYQNKRIYVAKFRWQTSETFLSLSPLSFYSLYMYVLNFKQYSLITVQHMFLNSDYSLSCDSKNLGTIWIYLFQWLFVLKNTWYLSIFIETIQTLVAAEAFTSYEWGLMKFLCT